MNNKTDTTICIEPELREKATALFEALGMDLSTATGIFYRQALHCQGLPFEVRLEEPNEMTYAAMEETEERQEMYGLFDSVEDMMEALNA